MTIRTLDLAWLGGLLEGEGFFGLNAGKYPVLVLRMSDQDTVARAAALFGVRVTGPYQTRANYKPTWLCQVSGARAVAWMLTLYVFLGERRRAAVAAAVSVWKAVGSDRPPSAQRARRGSRTPATCHPDRPARAGGQCKECYMRDYRARRAEG